MTVGKNLIDRSKNQEKTKKLMSSDVRRHTRRRTESDSCTCRQNSNGAVCHRQQQMLTDGVIVDGSSHEDKKMPNGMSAWDATIALKKYHT